MTWKTVPICDPCWEANGLPRTPARILEEKRVVEDCHHCGRETLSGIYVRRNVR